MIKTKAEWIAIFRTKGKELLKQANSFAKSREKKTSYINQKIKAFRDKNIDLVNNIAKIKNMEKEKLLEEILLVTYASYIVMLEYRNKVWEYDYMTFSRRIGELWEPFCKLPFEYPVKSLKLIEPPDFEAVHNGFFRRAITCINGLNISASEKKELREHYSIPWSLVDSGGIKLGLDLHFEQNGIHYNCDFKSGFSSNEKGNTNRLLLVASIYKFINPNEKTLLFVRQQEDENNHYLQTLKNSQLWDVYCADECYLAIFRFTGFEFRTWLDVNVDWHNDISPEFKKHLQANDLLKYLTW